MWTCSASDKRETLGILDTIWPDKPGFKNPPPSTKGDEQAVAVAQDNAMAEAMAVLAPSHAVAARAAAMKARTEGRVDDAEAAAEAAAYFDAFSPWRGAEPEASIVPERGEDGLRGTIIKHHGKPLKDLPVFASTGLADRRLEIASVLAFYDSIGVGGVWHGGFSFTSAPVPVGQMRRLHKWASRKFGDIVEWARGVGAEIDFREFEPTPINGGKVIKYHVHFAMRGSTTAKDDVEEYIVARWPGAWFGRTPRTVKGVAGYFGRRDAADMLEWLPEHALTYCQQMKQKHPRAYYGDLDRYRKKHPGKPRQKDGGEWEWIEPARRPRRHRGAQRKDGPRIVRTALEWIDGELRAVMRVTGWRGSYADLAAAYDLTAVEYWADRWAQRRYGSYRRLSPESFSDLLDQLANTATLLPAGLEIATLSQAEFANFTMDDPADEVFVY